MQTGEACDDGNNDNTDACLSTCLKATCGDGYVQKAKTSTGDGGAAVSLEECDDGNFSSTDACTNSCKLAVCGDGYLRVGVEECDDKNAVDTDACLTTCKKAKCGDGKVQASVEECDDSNSLDTDACLSTCKKAKCGDGKVQASVDECDDGNLVSGDWCSATCKKECTVGKVNFSASSGSCYAGFTTALSWADAAAACSVLDAHLVAIGDATENGNVGGLLSTTGSAWTGLTDQYGEGTFVWSVGKSKFLGASYTNWDTSQPDDKPGTTADCGMIASGGKWSDQACTELHSYICEYTWPVAK